MKKVLALFAVLLFASTCLAAEWSANLKIQTGDANLDLSLKNINRRAATPAGAIEVRREITQQFILPEKEIQFLNKKGYCLAEIYYLSLLAKKSGKPASSVAALHSKGIGWGVLAKKLGVKPNELNKLIVKEKKAEKAKEFKVEKNAALKVEKTNKTVEKTQFKETSPARKFETPRMHPHPTGGGSKGRGR